jgi:FtsP/CotA-like multicopper oxidase with cupredoxin domain
MPPPRFLLSHVCAALLTTILLASASAGAQSLEERCAYKEIDIKKYGGQEFRNPPNISAKSGSLNTDLNVQYTDPKVTSIAGCPVTLRTYNGQLVGPTLRMRAGDVMNIKLNNKLPVETPNQVFTQYQQEAKNAHLSTFPGSFNTTNLHTHGLHVSPVGNSDNVLLAIAPQSNFAYEIKVPRSHPSGSFWYHAHTHGSTSIQVGSGMAGALVIDDDEGKIPTTLAAANKNEKVMVFQTTLYNEKGELNDITALFPDPTNKEKKLDCEQIKKQAQMTWACSKRRITINGQIVPKIKMRPGEVQRWRMIDTAFRENIDVVLEGHALHEIALDGLYLGRIDTWPAGTPVALAPGYRSDVLVKASLKPGVYRLFDKSSTVATALRAVAEPENLLAEVIIEGEPIDMKLPTSKEMAALAPFGNTVLQPAAVGVQRVQFEIYGDVNADPKKLKPYFAVNNAEFNPHESRKVALGATDVWQVKAVGAPHVFHIHVNPFQFQRTGPDGKVNWVWKDTLLIQADKDPVSLYTTYSDYIGKFVMHCHILDHEDLGMMQVVEVVDQASGVARHHH